MTGTTEKMTDQKAIKQWVEARNGRPIRVAMNDTGKELDTIKFRFPDEEYDNPQTYQEITWKEWFAIFEHYKLEMVVTKADDDGKNYNYQLNNRNN